jgi:hypothetical protein
VHDRLLREKARVLHFPRFKGARLAKIHQFPDRTIIEPLHTHVCLDAIRLKGYFGIVVGDDFAVLGQHVDDLRFMAVNSGGCDVGCDHRIGPDAGTCPVPVVHHLR